jgi:hypothetical protein
VTTSTGVNPAAPATNTASSASNAALNTDSRPNSVASFGDKSLKLQSIVAIRVSWRGGAPSAHGARKPRFWSSIATNSRGLNVPI